MDGELKQLLKIKSRGKCACFKTENDSRFQKWKVALAQRYGNLPGGALEFSVTGLCPSKNFSSPNEGSFRVNRHPIGEFFIGNDTQ